MIASRSPGPATTGAPAPQHTETPWREARHKDGLFIIGSDDISSVVCQIREYPAGERYESCANAEFICLAVNQHHALVAALKEQVTVSAACMRVIEKMDQADAIDMFVDEIHAAGIKDGVGVRAKAILAQCEPRAQP